MRRKKNTAHWIKNWNNKRYCYVRKGKKTPVFTLLSRTISFSVPEEIRGKRVLLKIDVVDDNNENNEE